MGYNRSSPKNSEEAGIFLLPGDGTIPVLVLFLAETVY
jgi:hypothetical protein